MDKKTLISKLSSGNLSEKEKSDLLDEYMGKPKKTPIQIEVSEIQLTARKYPEVRELATKLVSKLKSEMEGRGKVPKDELDRRRKVFWAAVGALKEE